LCRLDLLFRGRAPFVGARRVRAFVRVCVRASAGRVGGVGGGGGGGGVCGGLRRRASATMALEFKKVLAKPIVASEDMTAEMAGETVEIITAAVDKFLSTENYEKAAQAVKDGMDRKFGPTWHCCIGEGFGYDVTYNTRNMLLLYYGEKLGILGA
jgi:dynein light chain 4